MSSKNGVVAMCFVLLAMIALVGWLKIGETAKANRKFDHQIAAAEAQTANPCGLHSIALVQPPSGSSKKAVLVIGGHSISNANVVHDIVFQPWEPVPGEHVVRVAIEPSAPDYQELIWLAYGTKACRDGFSRAIERYAISCGQSGNCNRPAWPVAGKEKP